MLRLPDGETLMDRTKVFVSYSRKDDRWKDRFVQQLDVVQRENLLEVWVDSKIKGGQDWYNILHKALLEARVAVLLVSDSFLTSNFILSDEVPPLMECHVSRGMRIIPVIVWPCNWQKVSWLSSFQVLPKHGVPLTKGTVYSQRRKLCEVASEILDIVHNEVSVGPGCSVASKLQH